jgi:predicted MFS family arabinose efflux permease
MENEARSARHTARNLLTRDFVFGFLAFFSFLAATSALVPTLPIYLVKLGSSEREIGVLVGITGVASLTSRLFVGRALLQYREKNVMMAGATLSAITLLSYIVLRSFWPFLIMRFLQGVALACLDTAAIACMINVIPLAYRARAIGYFMLGFPLAMAMAAPLAMFLSNQYGFTVLFLSCTCVSVCALFLSWKVKGQEISPSHQSTTAHHTFFLDLKIVVPALTYFLQSFAWAALAAFFPLYAIQCGVTNPGYFFSAGAATVIASRIIGGKILDNHAKEGIILTSLSLSMVAMVVLSFSKTLPMFIVVGLLWGMGCAFFFPAVMAYALDHARSSSGTAVGTYQAFGDLGMALGPVIMGIILPLTGYRIMFLGLGFACLVNLCYFQFYVRKRNNVARTI